MSTVFNGTANDVARTAVTGLVTGTPPQVGTRPEHPFLADRAASYYTGMATTAYEYQLAKTAYELWVALIGSMGVTWSLSPLGYASTFANVEDNVKIQLLREVEFHLTGLNGAIRGHVTTEQSHLFWVESAIRNGWSYQQWREDPVTGTFASNVGSDTENLDDTAHELLAGDIIYLTNSASDLPAGLVTGKAYYAIINSEDDFEAGTSPTATAGQTISDNGTGTSTWTKPGNAPKKLDTTNKYHHLVTDWRNVPREIQLRYRLVDAVLYSGLTAFGDTRQAAVGISGVFGPGNMGGTSPTDDGAGNTITPVYNNPFSAWGATDGGVRKENLIL